MVSEVVAHVYRPCWDVFDDLMHMLSSDTTVAMIYLDFSKAFNKVDHGVLLHNGYHWYKLGMWFFHFLTN